MGMRSWLEENPRAAVAVLGGVVVLAIGVIVVQVSATRQRIQTKLPDSYFTVDDGKSYFSLSSENVAPFEYKGQQAVAAYVFECSGKRFVGFLERYTPEARKRKVEAKNFTPQDQMFGRELKKPGEAKWVKSGDSAAVGKVCDVKCPDGHVPEPIEP